MILVTGGTGFLGQNLLQVLCAAGYSVRVITRHPQQYPWLATMPIEAIQADVEDEAAVKNAMQGVEYVIHAAAHFRFWGRSKDFRETNIVGTRHILDAALAAGVKKFIHVSTLGVIGFPRDPNIIIDENTPVHPVDDYQRTKVAGEELAMSYYTQHQLPVVIIRGGAFYGPYGRYGFNRVFIEDPLFNWLPLGVNRGQHLIFPAYIRDVARGILLTLEKGRAGEVYNLSSQNMTHREIIKTIARESRTPAFRIYIPEWLMMAVAGFLTWVSSLTGHEMRYVVNMAPYTFGEWNVSIEKAQRELGYEPTSFEQGVRETLLWYREIGVWKGKLRGE